MLARIGAKGVARSGNARREQQGVHHDSGAEGNPCQGRHTRVGPAARQRQPGLSRDGLTPLQEMEKKAADLEAALQRPFPEVEFVRMQVTARVGPYGARGQAPRPKVERFGSFTEALSTLYPSS